MDTFEIICAHKNGLGAQLREINDRIQKMRQEIEKKLKMTWGETYSHPQVAPLVEESTRLYREVGNLGRHLIRANLARFGIEDVEVTAKVGITSYGGDKVVRAVEVGMDTLSKFCLPFSLWPKVEIDQGAREEVKLSMPIFLGDEKIGHIDSSGRFNYTAAPNLRVCVGWAVASDYGREKVLEYDLDHEVEKLKYAIKRAPPVDGTHENSLKEFFFNGAWNLAIQEVMRSQHGSRFADGYCGVTTMFWKVATRTIRGHEHAAFPFYC